MHDKQKVANGITHEYYLNGSTIVAEKRTGNGISQLLTYYYDATGICGFRYKDLILGAYTDYQYRKNLQGDIIGIYGSGTTLEVTYRYDAWGNLLSAEGNTLLIDVNPFTYRGYYRDAETGWYYLNSRYYDPSVCRFINADDSAYLEPETLCGMNLYSYCVNNPVMYIDPTGHDFWESIGNWFKDNWVKLAVGLAFIIVGALVTALTAGAGIGFMAAFGSALLTSAVQVGISAGISALIGGTMSAITGGNFWEGFGNGLADGFMWGGIFAGNAQIVGGTMRGVNSIFGYNKTGKTLSGINAGPFRFLSPNKIYAGSEFGGTLFRIGQTTRLFSLDVGGRFAMHAHIISKAHIPLIPFITGVIEFGRWR